MWPWRKRKHDTVALELITMPPSKIRCENIMCTCHDCPNCGTCGIEKAHRTTGQCGFSFIASCSYRKFQPVEEEKLAKEKEGTTGGRPLTGSNIENSLGFEKVLGIRRRE